MARDADNARRPLPARLGWAPFEPPDPQSFAFISRRGARLSPAARELSAFAEERLLVIARQLKSAPRRRLPGERA